MNRIFNDPSDDPLNVISKYLSVVLKKEGSSIYHYLQKDYSINKNGLLDLDKLFSEIDSTNPKNVAAILEANQIKTLTQFPYNDHDHFLEKPQSIKVTLNRDSENNWDETPEIFYNIIAAFKNLNSIYLSIEDIRIFEKIMGQEKKMFNIKTIEITYNDTIVTPKVVVNIGKRFPKLVELRINVENLKVEKKNKKRAYETPFVVISRSARDVSFIKSISVKNTAEPSPPQPQPAPPSSSFIPLNLFHSFEKLKTFIIDYDFFDRFMEIPFICCPSKIGIILNNNQSKIINIKRLVYFAHFTNVETLEIILKYSVKKGDLFPSYPKCSTEIFSPICSSMENDCKNFLKNVIFTVEIDNKKIINWDFNKDTNDENLMLFATRNCRDFNLFCMKIDYLVIRDYNQCKIFIHSCLSCKLIPFLIKYFAKNVIDYNYFWDCEDCGEKHTKLGNKIKKSWNIGKVFDYFQKHIKDHVFELKEKILCDFFSFTEEDSTFKFETVKEIKFILEPQERIYLQFSEIYPYICKAFPNWTTFKIEDSG